MNKDSKAAKLITKLLRETLAGSIKWDITNPPKALYQQTEDVVPLYLEAEYKGKIFGVYECRKKDYFDVDAFHWIKILGFCIVDREGRVIWELDEIFPALYDLFISAREQASGIDDIFDEVLGD